MIKAIFAILLLLITQSVYIYPQPVDTQEEQAANYRLILFEYCQNPRN